MYDIQLTQAAQKFYAKADTPLTKQLNRCFAQLSQNPHIHPNIKRLSGKFSGFYRYRVGDYRVVYEIKEDNAIVIILIIAHRREVYR
ncbi:MAG: type II toxin-antitoxin system RelE/ParE family toxin [Chloroflexi bacterium]|nr:type II toxin-antitoxin system RelE/ParE family toxin [Chloroflexota bacterium]